MEAEEGQKHIKHKRQQSVLVLSEHDIYRFEANTTFQINAFDSNQSIKTNGFYCSVTDETL